MIMAGPYHIINDQGEELAGDMLLSDAARQYADANGFKIKDMSTGDIVYPEEG